MGRIDTCVEIASHPEASSVPLATPCACRGNRDRCCGKSTRCRCAHRLFADGCVETAQENPTRKVVFFGLGFETTSRPPPSLCNRRKRVMCRIFTLLPAHYAYPDASQFAGTAGYGIDAFLAPGHVSMVIGTDALILSPAIFIVRWWSLVSNPLSTARRGDAGGAENSGPQQGRNQYRRVVPDAGNLLAQQAIAMCSVSTATANGAA